jgi:uncharacterized membrane protein
MLSIAILLHLLSAVVWVGGMFFAYMVLRPVAGGVLEPPLRLELWRQIFSRFFPWVSLSIVILFVTGLWMSWAMFGGLGNSPVYVHIMLTLAVIMAGLFGWLKHKPVKDLAKAVIEENWQKGGEILAAIRKIIAINLSLGLLLVAIASGGRFL